MNIALLYVLVAVIGGALGQVLLKTGMSSLGPVTLAAGTLPSTLMRMASSPFVVVGLGFYAMSALFWLAALSRLDLSYVYPFASLGYVLMLIVSWTVLNEQASVLRVAGTVVIGLGVYLVSRS